MNSWLLILINHALSVAVREIYAAIPRLSYSLIRREASRLPEEIRDRYFEEWLAESETYVGSTRQLARAMTLALCGTAKQLTREYDYGQFEDLDEKVRRELSKVTQLQHDGLLLGERFERASKVGEVALAESVEQLESTIRGAIDDATARGQSEIAEKLSVLCTTARSFSQTVLKALALLRQYIGAEQALIQKVVLVQQATLLAAAGRLDHVHRALRRSAIDRDLLRAVIVEVRAQLDEINRMDLDVLDPARPNRQTHCARMQTALTEMNKHWSASPTRIPQLI